MTHEDIQGWFDFAPFYDWLVAEAPFGAQLVEVGSWKGKSSAYLARKIIEADRNLTLCCVDTWIGSPLQKGSQYPDMYLEWHANMLGCGVRSAIFAIRSESVAAASQFQDEKVWAVFLDADHSAEAVEADIAAWWPRIQVGGILGGHDWSEAHPGVPIGVKAAGIKPQINGTVWWTRKL